MNLVLKSSSMTKKETHQQQEEDLYQSSSTTSAVTYDEYVKAKEELELLNKELEAKFALEDNSNPNRSRIYMGGFHDLMLLNKDRNLVWSAIPAVKTGIPGSIKYGNYTISVTKEGVEDDVIAHLKMSGAWSNGTTSRTNWVKGMIEGTWYSILTKENDPKWLDQNTGLPAKFPLDGNSYFGSHLQMTTNKIVIPAIQSSGGWSYGAHRHVPGFDVAWYYETYLKTIAKVPIVQNAKKFSSVYEYCDWLGYSWDSPKKSSKPLYEVCKLMLEEKNKVSKRRSYLMKKINDKNAIIAAFNNGKSLKEFVEERKDNYQEKIAVSRGKRVGKELENLTRMLLVFGKIKTAINEVEKKALDENYKFDFSYFNRRMENIEPAIGLIDKFLMDQVDDKKNKEEE